VKLGPARVHLDNRYDNFIPYLYIAGLALVSDLPLLTLSHTFQDSYGLSAKNGPAPAVSRICPKQD
jgi:hypothetical protein